MRSLLAGVCIALLVSLWSLAQTQLSFDTKAPEPTNISGKKLFETHCALCHGADAKGGGPYATSLKTWPPDLTVLARKNNGKFPELHVSEVIDGEFEKPPHGSREMPIWGPIFRSQAHGKSDSAQVRIKALVRYIESVQEK